MSELVVGTAGHIDHGKTALVTALTGVDCDRLEEERRRGMTIELGFAPWRLPSGREVSVVDVPGHERFVRTMALGARSTDLALLCLAADDGVMPQTLEHAAILRLLRVRAAVVAVTKIDLAPDRAAEVGEQALELLAALGVPATHWAAVSAREGTGLSQLTDLVDAELQLMGDPVDRGCPRLLVDRAFSSRGHGTVATGVLDGGTLHEGEAVTAFPSGARGRILQLQRRGESRALAAPGGRLALALKGISVAEVPRGSVVGLLGQLRATSYLDCLVEVPLLGASGVRQEMSLEVLCGTSAVTGRLWLAGEDRLRRGQVGYGQLHLRAPIWALPGDRILLRAPSPASVLAGGLVLDAHPRPHRRWSVAALEGWQARERALLINDSRGPTALAVLEAANEPLGLDAAEASHRAGVHRQHGRDALAAAVASGQLAQLGSRFLGPDALQQLGVTAAGELRRHREALPMEPGMPRGQLLSLLGLGSTADGNALIRELELSGILEADGPLLKAPGSPATALHGDAVERTLSLLHAAGATAPTSEALQAAGSTREIAAYLERSGEAARLGKEVLISTDALQELQSRLLELLATQPQGMTVAQIRDQLGSSRRVLVPLLERTSGQRLTRRTGDLHQLAKRY